MSAAVWLTTYTDIAFVFEFITFCTSKAVKSLQIEFLWVWNAEMWYFLDELVRKIVEIGFSSIKLPYSWTRLITKWVMIHGQCLLGINFHKVHSKIHYNLEAIICLLMGINSWFGSLLVKQLKKQLVGHCLDIQFTVLKVVFN